MKFHYFGIFLTGILLSGFFSYGQDSTSITFIRFNSYIGYVIDSAENQKCKCVSFAGNKLRYGALIQLPDSSLEFRMKLTDRDGIYNIPMTKSDIEKMASRTPLIQEELLAGQEETNFLSQLAGDTAVYKLMDYYSLKYKMEHATVQVKEPRDSSFNYTYFNIGMGISSRSGIESYGSIAGDVGLVFNKNIVSGRIWYNRVINPDYSDVDPKEHITEAGLLYGRLFPIDKIAFTANAGISYSSGVLRGDLIGSWGATSLLGRTNEEYEAITFEEVGIPLKLEMLVGSRRKSKASFAVFADLNARYCYYGIIVSLRPSSEYRPLKPEHYPKSK